MQKTAYEMRISDWSSDVCSSDLLDRLGHRCLDHLRVGARIAARYPDVGRDDVRELCHRNRRGGDEAGERDNDRNDERDPRPVDEDVEHGSDPAVGRGPGRDGLTQSNLLQALDDDQLALLEAPGDDANGKQRLSWKDPA